MEKHVRFEIGDEARFGKLWGEVEWGGWNLVWIDSMNLIEGREGEMKDWLEQLGKGKKLLS